jgi:Asp-tRNA(Asn)/Glu-tRNA(Gln) amidotransferase A subunit family amidase
LVGLKATFGRVSEHGAFPLDWSIAHIGPMAWSAADTALDLRPDRGSRPERPGLPAPTAAIVERLGRPEPQRTQLGVYWEWFRHAEAEVVAACEAMLKEYEKMGCEIVEIVIPNLEANRVAHSVTILTEMAQAMHATYEEHTTNTRWMCASTWQWRASFPQRTTSLRSASAQG